MSDFTGMFSQILWLIVIDVVFLAICGGFVALLAYARRPAFAVLKRNFVGYFSNPTGYVFLLLFVFLTSAFAFCVHKFFANNLANLDQLNSVIPYIMLGFIPTITMSIWAEERRQGTDELLLTLPAGDFDIVVGKYLAAAAIFTVSLLFSQLSSYAVLVSLTFGEVDSGLLFATYLGYWFMGLAMLSVGMIASFLTNNLTVGFVLGALFNVPLVFAKTADLVIAKANVSSMVSRWSLASQFDDFGRGVISLASATYFILVAVIGVYLSIVLIGRRHWFNSSEGQSKWRVLGYSLVSLVTAFAILALLLYAWSGNDALGTSDAFARFGFAAVLAVLAGLAIGLTSVSLVSVIIGFTNPEWIRRNMFDQYVVRAMSLIGIVFGLTYTLANYDYARLDMTQSDVSSLSPETIKLVKTLNNQYPIVIDAYIGAQLPERYTKTEYDLRSLLKEFKSLAGAGIQVNIYDNLDRSSEEAREAESQYNIAPRRIQYLSKGAIRDEQVILGVGFRCGLEKVSVPFLDYGIPVEYELVRSLTTVAKAEREHRKKVFVVNTDAQMTGGFTMAMMQPQQIPEQQIVAELKKQYVVEQLDLTEPLDLAKVRKGDVILAVQPSSLGPQQLSNLVDAVKKGVPTAIFEDPATYFMAFVPGTMQPKRPPGGMFGGGAPQPKGDIHLLWKAIGISALGADSTSALSSFGSSPIDCVWQNYQPYKSLQLEQLGPDFVFIRNEQPASSDAKPAYNPEQPVVSNIAEMLFPVPGGVIRASDASGFDFTELIRTGDREAGRWTAADVEANRMDPKADDSKRGEPTGKQYVIAMEIKGKSGSRDDKKQDEKDDKEDAAKEGEEKAEKDKAKKGGAKSNDEAKSDDNDDQKKTDNSFVPGPIHVVYTADIDCLASVFVELRSNPNNEMMGDVKFNFENVSYVLNTIDYLAGDERFLAIRTRKFSHPTLRAVEMQTEDASAETQEEIRRFMAELKEKSEAIDKERDEAIKKVRDELEKAQKGNDYNKIQSLIQQVTFQEEQRKRKADSEKKDLERRIQQNINEIERRNEQEVQRIQNTFKAWALLLPLLPPLLLGLVVFARRRVKEREGISKERMR
jgi:ABC-2 type transport system permease protein